MDSTNTSWYDGMYPLYDFSDYSEQFLYQGFPFERIIYSYIWVILVTLTCFFNVIVISILLRKTMRNTTYMILAAISVSDSLTGLTTLPTYMAVFQDFIQQGGGVIANITPTISPNDSIEYYVPINVDTEGYILSETLCDAFMISKFFLSKTFHTASVWLTLFLAVQRFLVTKSPLQRFSGCSKKNTLIICVVIFLTAPVLHCYHLFNDKSEYGLCYWSVLTGRECAADCVFLWFAFMLGHFLPSIMLVVFTGIFVYGLHKTSTSLQNIGSRREKVNDARWIRQEENRRVSRVVTAIVVVFLIAELPYAGYLLYAAIFAHLDINMDFEFNRTIHAVCEILLVLSFNANFYIYTFFNQRFRKAVRDTFVSPVCDVLCPRICMAYNCLSNKYQRSPGTSICSIVLSDTSVKTQTSCEVGVEQLSE